VVIALLSLVSLRVGNSAPASVRKFVPAVVTSAVLTSVGVQRLGVARGTSPMHALRVYRTASGGVMGGSGVGDVTFAMAAPVIVGLGFRLFEQRALLWLHLGPLLGGSLANCVLSVSYTVLACRLVQVPADVGKSLVARFITLPMAVPLTEALGGSVALASLAASIQGIVAAAFCQQLLDLIGVRGRLARGLAIGGSAHALGTATAAGSDEPSIAPAAALCFMISGALMNLMACSPAAVNALVLLL
jgi:putative effector of murein hydrolase